ncbi:MAG: sugar phosphate nucleotidyltransferase [Planctomycetota bacterium]
MTNTAGEASPGRGGFWAIVLAGGFGRRVAGFTAAATGEELPKQFCRYGADRSLLQRTLERIAPLAAPERTVVVIDQSMHGVAESQLRWHPGIELIDQPRERGTGPGILLPLAHVLARDPDAVVLLVPSDHEFREPEHFRDSVRAAESCVAFDPTRIVLLAVKPHCPACDLGWIVPSRSKGPLNGIGLLPVQQFVEKPGAGLAAQLYLSGGVWNTMITVARGTELLELFRNTLSDVTRALEDYGRVPAAERAAWVAGRYETLRHADFSSSVLELAPNLTVLPLSRHAGWSDLGTPERLTAWIAAAGTLLPRGAEAAAPPPAAAFAEGPAARRSGRTRPPASRG